MSFTRPRTAALAAIGVVALALTACATGAGDAAPTPPAEAEPVAGGDLTFAISVDSQCIDPQQVGNNDAIAIARQTVASLTIQDAETGEILPWLAEEFEVNSDATSFTFTLQDGPTYADGEPIDAASVKTNFEAIVALGAKASLGSSYLADLESIEVVDEHTVTVNFSEPSAQFLQATSTFSPGPAVAWQRPPSARPTGARRPHRLGSVLGAGLHPQRGRRARAPRGLRVGPVDRRPHR